MFSNLLKKVFTRKRVRSCPRIVRAIVPVIESMEERTLFSFSAPISAGVGSTVSQAFVGDVNGDGRADVVELNSSSQQVTTLLGNGDGTFQSGISSPAGGTGGKMVVKDFNHDGTLDVVTCQGYSLDLLAGNGDGSFRQAGVYYVGAYANDVDAGDVNHDGFDDLCTASSSYGGTTQLLLNDGHGGFLPTRNLAIGPTGYHIRMGDVNGDGNLDLVEQGGSTENVMIGAGDGTFRQTSYVGLGYFPTDLQLADVNHDGMADLVATDGKTVSIYQGNAAGVYGSPVNTAVAGATAVKLGDVNNDGNVDVVTNNGLVMLGKGDGGIFGTTVYGAASGKDASLGDVNGDGVLDAVVLNSSVGGGVNVSLNGNNDKQLLGVTTQFAVSAPDTVGAGQPFAVTVSALDANGVVDPTFCGSVSVVGAAGTNPVYYTFTAADQGVATINNGAEFFVAGSATYSVQSPFLPAATGTTNVVGVLASNFVVTAQASTEAGVASTVTVAPYDAFGNPASSFLGTVHFTSSDVQAGLPADYTYTADDNGSHTFNVTLKTVGAQVITVNDAFNAAIKGRSNATTVTPSTAASLNVSGGGGFIGSTNLVTISALDAYGNIATGYTGTVHLATSDAASTTSADAALVNGVGTFTLKPLTIGKQTLTASDVETGSIAGTETVDVTPGWGVRFTMTPLSSDVAAGQAQETTVTMYDAFGNVSTVFNGYLAIRSTDPLAPVNYVYVSPADAGVKTVAVTLYTAGTQAVSISDYSNAGTSVAQSGIHVSPLAASRLVVTPLSGGVAGTVQNVTVSAVDMYGNVAPTYAGTISFASGDSLAALPANYTFTAADAGTHTFQVTLKSSGGQTFSVQDVANPLAMSYAQKDIAITAASMSGFSFKGASLSLKTAGAPQSFTVTASDAFGNAVTNYNGTVKFSSSDAAAGLPPSYSFAKSDNGTHTFNVTFRTAGTQLLTATDSVNAAIGGTQSGITVTAPVVKAASLVVTGTTAATAGVGRTFTVTARDASGNVVTNYTGTVTFSSSDQKAGLPASYTFTAGDAGSHVFTATLFTAGTQSITASDPAAGIGGLQSGIAVAAGSAVKLVLSTPSSVTQGVGFKVTVTALDAWGNIATGYRGKVQLTSTDTKGGSPASSFSSSDNGVHVFSFTFSTVGLQTVKAVDTADGTILGSATTSVLAK